MKELREYQKKAILDVRKSILSGNRHVILQAWVGSGKTLMAAEIIRMAVEKRRKVLFLAPRRQLIYQTVDTLIEHEVNCGMIMAGESPFGQPLVQVASFDTITSRVGKGRMELPEADLVITDEAHMCMSPARLKILRNYKTVIGLTATPALSNGRGMGIFYQDIVQSLSMKSMVDNGYLVPMRYFIGEAPDLSNAPLNKDGDYSEKFLAEANNKTQLIGDVYRNWNRIAPDRCTLIFAVNRSHARNIHDEFLRHGVFSEYIDGDTPKEERERIKKLVMTGAVQVVINIGVMVAGVDWPRIDCIVIDRQTMNIASWIQMIGRGSRLFPGKSDCIVIYHGDNFDDLGQIDREIRWSLYGKETLRERRERDKKENKEPKDLVCKECKSVFSGLRLCPVCGYELIKKGEPIPFYESELKEVKTKSVDKQRFYAELLGYAMIRGRGVKWALAVFRARFNEWPYNKNNITPIEPRKETLAYIQYQNIKWRKRNERRNSQTSKG